MQPSNTTVVRPPAGRKPPAARAIPATPTPEREVEAVTTTPALAEKTERLRRLSASSLDALFGALETSHAGLTAEEARVRIAVHGPNEIAHEGPPAWYRQLATAFRNPFIVVLIVLAVIQRWSSPDDLKGPVLIAVMVTLSVVIRFVQEYRSNHAAEQLRALVRTTATVCRPSEGGAVRIEIPLGDLVPGDVVALAAGDMVPADLRVLTSKDLFISQAALTGEAMPVEKVSRFEARDRELVATAIHGAAQLSGIVVEFLDLTRIEAGQLRLNLDRVDVRALVDSAVSAARPSCDDAGVALGCVVADDVPGTIAGDRTRLGIVLANLLTNALKYSPSGGTIGVEATRDTLGGAPAVRLTVTDTGPGVPIEHRERVFDKFFRVEHEQPVSDEGVRGSGIGLYIAREIMQAHGGSLVCEANPAGRGARFVVRALADDGEELT
jgi:signal transduction histidine kinase